MPATSPGRVYGAAVERWGDAADARIDGSYAAVVCLPDGEVRLARSPWGGRSLFVWRDADHLVVSSILRPMFAAGVPRRLRQAAVDAMLTFDLVDPRQALFEDIEIPPVGHVLRLGRDTRRLVSFYDIDALPGVRLRRDEDYVEAANGLLADAVAASLRDCARPGVTLSGGLDSPIVCDEVMRQRGERPVTSFTFGPIAEWDGRVAGHKFGDDRPAARAFAAMHPGLEAVFIDNRGIDFDYRMDEHFLAGDVFHSASVSGSQYHGLHEAARERGCDWLLFAGGGNSTFSNDAPWAASEFFRTGQWRQLWLLAARALGDHRPMWRRLAAKGLVPNLPPRLRRGLLRLVHGAEGRDMFANPYLHPSGRLAEQVRAREGGDAVTIYSDGTLTSSADFARRCYGHSGVTVEMWEVSEQVFGIRTRDVTVYRPLIEFCLGLPTRQYVRGGETRLLARRMAQGRMPEEQRLNELYGDFNVDWHARMRPRLPALRREVAALRDHPDLAGLIDVDRMVAALDDFPAATPADPGAQSALRFCLPVVVSVGRYLDYVSGRNPGQDC